MAGVPWWDFPMWPGNSMRFQQFLTLSTRKRGESFADSMVREGSTSHTSCYLKYDVFSILKNLIVNCFGPTNFEGKKLGPAANMVDQFSPETPSRICQDIHPPGPLVNLPLTRQHQECCPQSKHVIFWLIGFWKRQICIWIYEYIMILRIIINSN